MSLKDVVPGKYVAKAIRGGWGKSKEKQTPCVAVEFEFDGGELIWWTGYLTEKTVHRTFETLARLGYKEVDLIPDEKGNPCFTREKHLADKEVEIVIEIEENDGKSYHRVQWINDLGGSSRVGLPVSQVLGSINLKAELAAARARLGIVNVPVKKQDDLPF
jgi:hypothetical protein